MQDVFAQGEVALTAPADAVVDVSAGASGVGGLAGLVTPANAGDTAFVLRAYATGRVRRGDATVPVGGAFGGVTGAVSLQEVYWDTETTQQTMSAGMTGVTGLPTERLQSVDTFAAWDTSVWNVAAGSYPALR